MALPSNLLGTLPRDLLAALGDDVDLRDEEAVRARVLEMMASSHEVEQGRARVVTRKVAPGKASGGKAGDARVRHATGEAAANAEGEARSAKYATNYNKWANFDTSSDDEGDGGNEELLEERLEEVPQEEQMALQAQQAAETAAQRARDEGNACFKRGELRQAEEAYWRGLRSAPSAALLANRALVRLRLHDAVGAARDASKALRLEPSHTKALMRRAKALQALGRFDEALADCQLALEAEPESADLQRLQETVVAAEEQAAAAGALRQEVTAARKEREAGTLQAGGRGAQLLETEECVARLVAHAAAQKATQADKGDGGSDSALATTKAIRFDLTKLRRLMGGGGPNAEHFVAQGGVEALAAVYSEDNHGVLATLAAAAAECETALECVERDQALLARVVATVSDRRVGVIAAGLELLAALLERKVAPVLVGLADAKRMETLATMMARGPATLRDKAAAVLAPLAEESAAARRALRPAATSLAEATVRGASADNPEARLYAAMLAASAARGDASLREALATEAVCEAMLKMLDAECRRAPETRRVALARGASLSFRAVGRLADGTRRTLQAALEALAALCARTDFAARLHASPSGWLLVVPLLRDATPPIEAAAALCLARAAARIQEVAPAIAELGASGALLELVSAPQGSRDSRLAREAAAEALMLCAPTAAFQQEMSHSDGIESMVSMMRAGTPDRLLACVAEALGFTLRYDASKLDAVLNARPDALTTLIDLWYARSGECREAVESVLRVVMGEERAAKYITEQAEEEQIIKFVDDFRAANRARAAAATGGASLQRDADEEYANLGELQTEAAGRDALAGKFDAVKAARYLRTVLPPKPAVAFLGDKTGALALNLAEALAGQGIEAYTYSALEARMWAEFVETRIRNRNIGSSAAVVKTEAAADVASLPVTVDLLVVACNAFAEIFKDEATLTQELEALKAKLNPAGKIVLVEEYYDTLVTAKESMAAAGYNLFSRPDVCKEFFFVVMAPQ